MSNHESRGMLAERLLNCIASVRFAHGRKPGAEVGIRRVTAASLLIMALSGCDRSASRTDSPSFRERQAQRPWTTATSLREGRKLHRERCLTCHGEATRELYAPTRWKQIVDAMSERSRLDTTQARLVLDWILVGDSAQDFPPGGR